MTWGKGTDTGARGTFEEEWPGVARVVDRVLRNRRVSTERREDIVQETGLRLFTKWPDILPDRSVLPLAITIAMNLLKDEIRMQARREARPIPVDEVSSCGVEEEALARLELERVAGALSQLSPAQRHVLLAEIGAASNDQRGADALKMLRMRARRSLRIALERASALAPLGWATFKRVLRSAAVSVDRNGMLDHAPVPLSAIGLAGAAAAVTVALGAVVIPGARSGLPDAPGLPSRVPVVAALAAQPRSREPPTSGGRAETRRAEMTSLSRRVARSRDERAREQQPAAGIGAGGTGIDEEPSPFSENLSAWAAVYGSAGGKEAAVLVHVEQPNPLCGSKPSRSGKSSRSCNGTVTPVAGVGEPADG